MTEPFKFVVSNDPAKARQAIDAVGLADLGDVIYATSEGLIANGATNISTAFGNVLTSAPSGSILQLGSGDYYVPSLRNLSYSNRLVIRGVPGKTRLLGNGHGGGAPTSHYVNDVMLAMMGGSITFEDITFENVGVVLGIRDYEELGDINFEGCTFINCGAPVANYYDPTRAATRAGAGHTMAFNNFRFASNIVSGCNLGVYLKVGGGWKSIRIHDNVFDDVGRAAVWTGFVGAVDRATVQPNQAAVTVHDNIIRNVRETTYSEWLSNPGANGVIAMGQAVTIHDNYIENCQAAVWDDSEGIYTKARWCDIHDNTLINAGGYEAAIMTKGIYADLATTLDVSMNGLTLPQASITLASTQGIPSPRLMAEHPSLVALITTSAGPQEVNFTGISGNTLTGCTGGTGTMSTGGAARMIASDVGTLDAISSPSRVRGNTIVFTKTDRVYRGIGGNIPGIHVTDNFIDGATGRAIGILYGAVCAGNVIHNHHGEYCIGVFGGKSVVRGNRIFNLDGSYVPAASSYQGIWIASSDILDVDDVLIEFNQIINELTPAGALPAASAKLRAIQMSSDGAGTLGRVCVRGNVGRNISSSIHLTSSTSRYAQSLQDIDNVWTNDDGSAVANTTSRARELAYRRLPTTGEVASSGLSPYGAQRITSMSAPAAPTVTPAKVGGATTWTYYVVAVDKAGNRGVPSPAGTTATGAAALSSTDYNFVTWPAVDGAAKYDLLRADTGHSVATDLAVPYYKDTGGATSAYSPSGSNPAGTLTVDSTLTASTTIELGHASDTTLSRIAAGRIGVEGVELVRRTIQTVTNAVTLGALGDYIVLIGASGAPTLPTAVSNVGVYRFKNIDTAAHTIATTSAQTVEGLASYTLPAGAAIDIASDGSNWRIL